MSSCWRAGQRLVAELFDEVAQGRSTACARSCGRRCRLRGLGARGLLGLCACRGVRNVKSNQRSLRSRSKPVGPDGLAALDLLAIHQVGCQFVRGDQRLDAGIQHHEHPTLEDVHHLRFNGFPRGVSLGMREQGSSKSCLIPSETFFSSWLIERITASTSSSCW